MANNTISDQELLDKSGQAGDAVRVRMSRITYNPEKISAGIESTPKSFAMFELAAISRLEIVSLLPPVPLLQHRALPPVCRAGVPS